MVLMNGRRFHSGDDGPSRGNITTIQFGAFPPTGTLNSSDSGGTCEGKGQV